MVSEASVGGVGRFAAAVADSRANNSVETPELGVGAPESTKGEGGGLDCVRRTLVDRGR